VSIFILIKAAGPSTSKAGIEVWQKDVLDFINAAF